jgi:hypothetical protein
MKFWMVFSPTGGTPRREHGSEADAIAEATRLARANPGKHFITLEAMDVFESPEPPITRKALAIYPDIPF